MTEFEKSMFGAILLSNNCIPRIFATGIAVEHCSKGGQDVFRVVQNMVDRGSSIDTLTLPEALADSGRYEVPDKRGEERTADQRRVDSVNKAAEEIQLWLNSVTNTEYAVDHAKSIMQAARRRNLVDSITEAARLRDAPTATPEDLRAQLESMIEKDDRLAIGTAPGNCFADSLVSHAEFMARETVET